MIKYVEKSLTFEELDEFQKRNNISLNSTKERFDWQYYKNPFGRAKFYCAYDGNTLVGTEILMPLKMSIPDKTFDTALAVGSLIDSNYRGKGIWKKLLILSQEESKNEGIKIIWGPPNKNSYPILINHTNWKYICDIDSVVCYRRINPESGIRKKIIQGVSVFYIKCKNISGDNLKIVEFDDNNFDKVQSAYLMVYKPYEYLKWRYLDVPEGGFNLHSIQSGKNGESVGFIVYKIVNYKMYIFDFFIIDDNNVFKDFVGLIQKISKENGCWEIVLNINHQTGIYPASRKYGFYKKGNYKILANILDNAYKETFFSRIWDLKMGDEDINFCRAL